MAFHLKILLCLLVIPCNGLSLTGPANSEGMRRLQRFEYVHKIYEHGNNPAMWAKGRKLKALPQGAISLDFEAEREKVEVTPETVLAGYGIDIWSSEGVKGPTENTFPNISSWFSVDFEGCGQGTTLPAWAKEKSFAGGVAWIPDPTCLRSELTSVVMRPKQVLDKFLPAFASYAHNHRYEQQVPRHVQFTVGIPLSRVLELFGLSTADTSILNIVRRVNQRFPNTQSVQSKEYKSFVALAAYVLVKAGSCGQCTRPKFCMRPWLVRTHLGDIAKFAMRSTGRAVAQTNLLDDVSWVAGRFPKGVVYRSGITDGLKLPGIAEVAGLIENRADANTSSKQVPTSPSGWLSLAAEMISKKTEVSERLQRRLCGVLHGPHSLDEQRDMKLTVHEWLAGVHKGIDLLSDHDSPIAAKHSFGNYIYQSMGSWRMEPDDHGRVYIECRNPSLCLEGLSKKRHYQEAQIEDIAEHMLKFERADK